MVIKRNGGKITKKEQDMYDAIRYYIMISYLKKNNLITCDGVDEETNQKIWKFTEKGKRVADLIEELWRILYEGKSNIAE